MEQSLAVFGMDSVLHKIYLQTLKIGSCTRLAGVKSDHTPANLSPAALKIFQEAQQNILELNESRLRALEELEAAKARIKDLELRLETAAKLNQAPKIYLYYETSWDSAFIHFVTNLADWTVPPGQPMKQGEGVHQGKYLVTIEGSQLEFVLTNGKGEWDKAAPSKNYSIPGSGTWLLAKGQLTRLD